MMRAATDEELEKYRDPKRFDAFVEGGAEEAEAQFRNNGGPFFVLSTRYDGPSWRVAMQLTTAAFVVNKRETLYNPNIINRLIEPLEGESEDKRKERCNTRWLRSFVKALKHAKRTGGALVRPVHKDKGYSQMQLAEADIAEMAGVPVYDFDFFSHEVSEMGDDGKITKKRDESGLKARMEAFMSENEIFQA